MGVEETPSPAVPLKESNTVSVCARALTARLKVRAAIAMATKENAGSFLCSCASLLKICAAELLFVEHQIRPRGSACRAARRFNYSYLRRDLENHAARKSAGCRRCAAQTGFTENIAGRIHDNSRQRTVTIGSAREGIVHRFVPASVGSRRKFEDSAAAIKIASVHRVEAAKFGGAIIFPAASKARS